MNRAIRWIDQFHYDEAIEESNTTGKPILIDLHSERSVGACRLVETYAENRVSETVSAYTVPVRVHVETKESDPVTSSLVGSHIFIMSPTVQLISGNGDIYHKFLGSPLATRLDLGYTRVHHDIEGHLPPDEFLGQLHVGLGKWLLFHGECERSRTYFAQVASALPEHGLSHKEAAYWDSVAAGNAYLEDSQPQRTNTKEPLAREIERFCEALVRISDDELMRDWKGKPGLGSWVHYTDCLREVVFGIYQLLLDTAIEIAEARNRAGNPLTEAQRILKAWHISYRQLQGIVVGLRGPDLDRQHCGQNYSLGKQRTIRNNLVHCVTAEFWAHAPAIRQALSLIRNDESHEDDHQGLVKANWDRFGPPPFNFGPIGNLIETSETRHAQLLAEFATITDKELDSQYRWWEATPVAVRFRLNRMGWHLQDHAAVVETICERIGRVRTETERLVARVYTALGEAEGSLVGLSFEERTAALGDAFMFVSARADELEELYDPYRYNSRERRVGRGS